MDMTWGRGSVLDTSNDVGCIGTKQKFTRITFIALLLLFFYSAAAFVIILWGASSSAKIKSFNRIIISSLENRHGSRVFFYFRFRSNLAVWHFLSGLTLSHLMERTYFRKKEGRSRRPDSSSWHQHICFSSFWPHPWPENFFLVIHNVMRRELGNFALSPGFFSPGENPLKC